MTSSSGQTSRAGPTGRRPVDPGRGTYRSGDHRRRRRERRPRRRSRRRPGRPSRCDSRWVSQRSMPRAGTATTSVANGSASGPASSSAARRRARRRARRGARPASAHLLAAQTRRPADRTRRGRAASGELSTTKTVSLTATRSIDTMVGSRKPLDNSRLCPTRSPGTRRGRPAETRRDDQRRSHRGDPSGAGAAWPSRLGPPRDPLPARPADPGRPTDVLRAEPGGAARVGSLRQGRGSDGKVIYGTRAAAEAAARELEASGPGRCAPTGAAAHAAGTTT